MIEIFVKFLEILKPLGLQTGSKIENPNKLRWIKVLSLSFLTFFLYWQALILWKLKLFLNTRRPCIRSQRYCFLIVFVFYFFRKSQIFSNWSSLLEAEFKCVSFLKPWTVTAQRSDHLNLFIDLHRPSKSHITRHSWEDQRENWEMDFANLSCLRWIDGLWSYGH